MEKLKSIFRKREKINNKKILQNGSYMASVTAIVVVLVIVVNFIIGALPVKYTEFDVTSQKLYTIGSQTEELVGALKDDVTLYYLMQSGNEDETIIKLLERYEDLSSHITVVHKDVVKYPNFISSYTDDSVTLNSILVECGDRYKIVDYYDIYPSSFDYSSYSYTSDGFDGEGQITSAIAYVTGDDLPKMYILEGHNEASLSSSIQSSIEKENIVTEQLSLLTADAVPEDAACLLIHVPTVDLSAEEAEKIKTYLNNGGKALIVSGYTGTEMPNLDSIMEAYGVEKTEGIVFEGDNQHYISGVPYYVVPEVEYADVTADLYSEGRYILLPVAQGLTITDTGDESIEVSSLLTTTDSAYAKTDVANMQTYAQEDGDVSGPFSLGVAVTKAIEIAEDEAETTEDTEAAEEVETTEDTEAAEEVETTEDTKATETVESKVVYFTSEALLDESVDAMVSGGNSELFMNALSWMVDHEVTVSIDMKSTSVEYITMTSGTASMLSILCIGVVPVIVLGTGFVIWMKRRKQ